MPRKSKRKIASDDHQDSSAASANNALPTDTSIETYPGQPPKKRRRNNAKNTTPRPTMATRSVYRHAAITAVIATTELLENILINLPMKDLLLDQRVCKKWKTVIDGNKALQQKLFFVPVDHGFNYYQVDRAVSKSWGTGMPNTPGAGQDVAHGEDLLKPITEAEWHEREWREICYRVCWVNPLLGLVPSITIRSRQLWHGDKMECNRINILRRGQRGASWTRMLLTQPPMTEGIAWEYDTGIARERLGVQDPLGVRLDLLFGVLLKPRQSLVTPAVCKPRLYLYDTFALGEGELEKDVVRVVGKECRRLFGP